MARKFFACSRLKGRLKCAMRFQKTVLWMGRNSCLPMPWEKFMVGGWGHFFHAFPADSRISKTRTAAGFSNAVLSLGAPVLFTLSLPSLCDLCVLCVLCG